MSVTSDGGIPVLVPGEKQPFKVNGIEVLLPPGIELYQSQRRIIVRTIQRLCVSSQENLSGAVFEAATGTGKTLALLTAVSSFLVHFKRHRSDECPVHATAGVALGTDSDDNECCEGVNPVASEFGRLEAYKRGRIRHTVLASRQHLCINEKVVGAGGSRRRCDNDITAKCMTKLDSNGGGCRQYTTLMNKFAVKPADLRSEIRERLGGAAFDIENIATVLKDREQGALCPYYAATEVLAMAADLIFCTYSYIWDPITRSSKKVDLSDAIVIVDEAHNLTDVCCEAGTFDFSLHRMRLLSTELSALRHNADARLSELDGNEKAEPVRDALKKRMWDIEQIKRLVDDFIKWAEQRLMMIWRAEKDDHVGQAKLTATLEDGTFHRTLESFFYEDSIDVSAADASPSLSSLLPHVQAAFNAIFELEDREPVCLTSKDDAKTRPLHDSCNVLVRLTYAFYFLSRHRSDYKCTFELGLDRCGIAHHNDAFDGLVRCSVNSTVRFWPLTAAPCFRDVVDSKLLRAIFLASGTLSPIESFYAQLGYEFAVAELSMPTVVPADHIFSAAVVQGPLKRSLNSAFKYTQDEKSAYFVQVASIITNTCKIVPAGVLCFFSSYRKLQCTVQAMERNALMRELKQYKEVCIEEEAAVGDDAIVRHRDAINEGRGSLLMAVFRGKISEGINLAGDQARCVVICGIPFANIKDHYVSQRFAHNGGIKWLKLQAFQAISQALGRSLRNAQDWSAFLLLDERFADPDFAKYLPFWAVAGMEAITDIKVLGPVLKTFCAKFGSLQPEKPPTPPPTVSQFVALFKQPPPPRQPPRKKPRPCAPPTEPLPPEEQTIVYVKRLHCMVGDADIVEVFGRVGQILHVRGTLEVVERRAGRMKHKDTVYGCYIQYRTVEEARKAVELFNGAV